MPYFVYILASRAQGAIYIGMANNLRQRVEQHKVGAVAAHTRRYGIHTLVWFETHESLNDALLREKRIKRWARDWKDELIEKTNPTWQDISDQLPL